MAWCLYMLCKDVTAITCSKGHSQPNPCRKNYLGESSVSTQSSDFCHLMAQQMRFKNGLFFVNSIPNPDLTKKSKMVQHFDVFICFFFFYLFFLQFFFLPFYWFSCLHIYIHNQPLDTYNCFTVMTLWQFVTLFLLYKWRICAQTANY